MALYVLVLVGLTLGRSPGDVFEWLAWRANRTDSLHFVTVSDVEVTLNVALFLPAGLLLGLALPRVSRWVVWELCVLASLSVELVQSFLPDRDATPRDLVTNAIGAAIGVLISALLTRRTRQPLPD